MTLKDKLEQYFDDKKVISGGCVGCPYSGCTRAEPDIIGDAKILVVGEAPGEEEEKQKKVFVGRSGQLLREAMKDAGVVASVANVVQCRPPENEQPAYNIIKRCAGKFLTEIIDKISPKVVVAVGASPMKFWFGAKKKPERGTINKFGDLIVIPTFHPAAILYSGGMKSFKGRKIYDEIVRTLRKAKNTAEGKDVKRNYQYIRIHEKDKLLELQARQWDLVSFDIETYGNSLLSDDVRTVALSTGQEFTVGIEVEQKKAPKEWVEVVFTILNVIFAKGKKLIGHNSVKFDRRILKHFGVVVDPAKCEDTMLLAYLLDENRKTFGLKSLSAEYIEAYQYIPEDFMNVPVDVLMKYNCDDALNTFLLWQMFIARIETDKKMLWVYRNIMIPMGVVYSEMEETGIGISIEEAKRVGKELAQKVMADKKFVEELIGGRVGQSAKLIKFLYEDMGYEIPFTTDGKPNGTPSVDKEALAILKQRYDCPVCEKVLEIRRVEKLLSTYIEPYQTAVGTDGRLHSSFNQCGTVTGRPSSSDPNVLNIPRNKEIRGIVAAREGYLLIEADLSQAELRVGCSLAGERTMIKAYNEDKDLHKLLASVIYGKRYEDVTKEERQVAKSANFGLIYGAGAKGLKSYAGTSGIKMSLSQAEEIRNTYFRTYADLRPWYDKIEKMLQTLRVIESPFGRKRRFPEYERSLPQKIKDDMFRQAINFPVQSGSADIMQLVIIEARRRILEQKLDTLLELFAYDSIIAETREKDIDWFVINLSEILSNIATDWLKVPMVLEFKVGPRWRDMKEL